MVDHTSQGFPFMEDTDPAGNAPVTSEELADWLNTHVGNTDSGSFSATLVANTTLDRYEAFHFEFPAIPTGYSIHPVNGSPQNFACAPKTRQDDGCTWSLRSTTSGTFTFVWMVHGHG